MIITKQKPLVRVREIISESDNSIKFRCPVCKRKLLAGTDMFGEIIDCPNCKARFKIPNPFTVIDIDTNKLPPPIPNPNCYYKRCVPPVNDCWCYMHDLDYWAMRCLLIIGGILFFMF